MSRSSGQVNINYTCRLKIGDVKCLPNSGKVGDDCFITRKRNILFKLHLSQTYGLLQTKNVWKQSWLYLCNCVRFYPIGSIEIIVSPSNLPKLNFKAGRLIGNTIRLNSLTCIIDIIWCLILYNVCHLNQLNVTILLFTLWYLTKKNTKRRDFLLFYFNP